MSTRLIPALVGLLALTGCNTMEGVGRDLTSAGETIAGAAENARR